MDALSLDQFPQPEHNDSSSVKAALATLRGARDEVSAAEAYGAFLWSVGNHPGTFYPVVLAVLPEIEEILVNGEYWAQRATIEAPYGNSQRSMSRVGLARSRNLGVRAVRLNMSVHRNASGGRRPSR